MGLILFHSSSPYCLPKNISPSIFNNIIKKNGYHGITIRSSNNNTILDNVICDNEQGNINLQDSWYNIISSNIICHSKSFHGMYLYQSNGNNISNNEISNNGVAGICLYLSSNNTISGNTLMGNDNDGIFLSDSSYNNISSNTILFSIGDGIYIVNSYNCIIRDNNISSNGQKGVRVAISCKNIIKKNTIRSNAEYGIIVHSSSDNNLLYHNNFKYNQINATDEGSNNAWDNGYLSGGNHWDDYNGTDTNGDGLGDRPYNIPGGDNQDRYPLMHPFELYYILNISAPLEVNEGAEFNITIKSMGGPVVPDAVVGFNDELKFTDSYGRAYFTAPQVGEDTYYEITATKEGYTGCYEMILVKDIPFERMFMFGRINNLNTSGYHITFNVVNVGAIKKSPFVFMWLSSGENISIGHSFEGLLGAIWGREFIFAKCDAFIK